MSQQNPESPIKEDQLTEFYLRLSRRYGAVSFAIGLVALVGWALGLHPLTCMVPGLRPMKLSSALSFMLMGVALFFFVRNESRMASASGARKRSGLILACSALVVLLGTTTLILHFWGVGPHVDIFYAAEPGFSVPTPVGRMSSLSAMNFVFLGVALMLMEVFRSRYFAWQALTLCTLLLSTVGVLAYLYGASTLTRLFPYASVPFHNSVAFVLLTLAMFFSRPNQGIMSVFSSTKYGGFEGKRLLPLSILTLVMLGIVVRHGLSRFFADPGVSIVFVVALGSGLISVIIWWNSRRLNQFDTTRELAQEELRKVNDELELRVRQRTHELDRHFEYFGVVGRS